MLEQTLNSRTWKLYATNITPISICIYVIWLVLYTKIFEYRIFSCLFHNPNFFIIYTFINIYIFLYFFRLSLNAISFILHISDIIPVYYIYTGTASSLIQTIQKIAAPPLSAKLILFLKTVITEGLAFVPTCMWNCTRYFLFSTA